MSEPLLYSDIAQAAQEELEMIGLDTSDDMARRIARRFCDRHKQKVYRVPTLKRVISAQIHAQIRKDYKTMTIKQLIKKYDFCERHIRWIVSVKS